MHEFVKVGCATSKAHVVTGQNEAQAEQHAQEESQTWNSVCNRSVLNHTTCIS